MSLLEDLKGRLTASRKAGEAVRMSVLQVVLGDASMVEARTGQKAGDEEVEKIIRKVLMGNQETMSLMEKQGQAGAAHARLAEESAFLQSLLPQSLSVEAIVAELAAVADAVRGARNDGQATGVAMKHLKGKGLRVQGEDVAAAVRQVRG